MIILSYQYRHSSSYKKAVMTFSFYDNTYTWKHSFILKRGPDYFQIVESVDTSRRLMDGIIMEKSPQCCCNTMQLNV